MKDSDDTGKTGGETSNEALPQPEVQGEAPRKDCLITSPDGKKRLIKEWFEQKKKIKAAKSSSSYTDVSDFPNAEDGRYRIYIEDEIIAVALDDTGADLSAILEDIAAKLESSDAKVVFKKFKTPMELVGAFKTEGNVKLTATSSVALSITIILPGSKIPIESAA